MKPTTNSHQRAFTLIELLVVIAIIAILAAILFPVFAQAKLAAKKAADLSNMKNIATGQLIYSGDSDDMMVANGEGMVNITGPWTTMTPYFFQTNFGGGTNSGAGYGAPLGFMDPSAVQNWGRETMPYIKSMDVLNSPNASPDVDPNLAPVRNNSRAGRTSYAMNGCASNKSQTSFAVPANLIVVQPVATSWRVAIAIPRMNGFPGEGPVHANDADLSWAGFGFGDNANYAFADGHAKTMKRRAVKFKNFGFFEWVNQQATTGWTDPNTNPTMKADPKTNKNYWDTWGACNPTNEPQGGV